jgi:hypothetical protein
LAGRLTHSRTLSDHALYFRKRKMMSVEPNTEMDLMHRLMDVLGHEDGESVKRMCAQSIHPYRGRTAPDNTCVHTRWRS